MHRIRFGTAWRFCVLASICSFALSGCQTARPRADSQAISTPAAACDVLPRELSKVALPTYRIEPPDILLIDANRIVPRSPYRLVAMDLLGIDVQGTLSDAPISGVYPIHIDGSVDLRFPYGAVRVDGLSVPQARQAIQQHLRNFLKEPLVTVTLAEIGGRQQIAGEHLVGPDGMVTLGSYGSVRVVGMTLAQAKWTIEQHLSQFLDAPDVSVDVFAYNSKVYYVITQGAGTGDRVYRFPVTGNETVLDAISQVNGLEEVSSKKIWIARPTPQPGNVLRLPIDWNAITADGSAVTNYQVLPGDRVFIAEDKWVAFDTGLAKFAAPLERVMGFSLLGAGTVTRFSGPVLRGGGNRQANF